MLSMTTCSSCFIHHRLRAAQMVAAGVRARRSARPRSACSAEGRASSSDLPETARSALPPGVTSRGSWEPEAGVAAVLERDCVSSCARSIHSRLRCDMGALSDDRFAFRAAASCCAVESAPASLDDRSVPPPPPLPLLHAERTESVESPAAILPLSCRTVWTSLVP